MVPVLVLVPVLKRVIVELAVTLADCEPERDWDGDSDEEAVTEGEVEGDTDGLPVTEADCEGLTLGERLGDTLPVGELESEGLLVAVTLGVGVADGETDGETLGERVFVAVTACDRRRARGRRRHGRRGGHCTCSLVPEPHVDAAHFRRLHSEDEAAGAAVGRCGRHGSRAGRTAADKGDFRWPWP